ncbi:MAG: hypothetical protein QOD67_498, partial [Caballeronia sp.]|nr:hypothetical protein [Caballeronia sp.]
SAHGERNRDDQSMWPCTADDATPVAETSAMTASEDATIDCIGKSVDFFNVGLPGQRTKPQ